MTIDEASAALENPRLDVTALDWTSLRRLAEATSTEYDNSRWLVDTRRVLYFSVRCAGSHR